MKTLIRYNNRKIYDSDIRNYVNLSDILEMIAQGYTISVTEKDTGADITAHVLALALVELTKEGKIPSYKIMALLRGEELYATAN